MASSTPGTFRQTPCPPVETDLAPVPGVSEPRYVTLRRTARMRPSITPVVLEDASATLGYPHADEYVRRFWVPILGPGAVADLLRLATAAQRGRSLTRPIHLATLARHGLVVFDGENVMVRTTIPPLERRQVTMLPPALRRRHASYRLSRRGRRA